MLRGSVLVLLALAVPVIAMPATTDGQAVVTGQYGELVVREHDESTATYIEGAVSHLVLRRISTGRVVLKANYVGRIRLDSFVSHGRYKLITYARPCVGNCDTLDPPTDGCSAKLSLLGGDRISATVHIRTPQRCQITF